MTIVSCPNTYSFPCLRFLWNLFLIFIAKLHPQTATLVFCCGRIGFLNLFVTLLFVHRHSTFFFFLDILTTRKNIVLILALKVEKWRLEVQGHPWLNSNLRPDWVTWDPGSKQHNHDKAHTYTTNSNNDSHYSFKCIRTSWQSWSWDSLQGL